MTIEEVAVKLTEVDDRSRSNTHRINELAEEVDAVNRLAVAVEVMATEQKHQTEAVKKIETDLDNVGRKVEAIEQKPAKRWDGLKDKVVWTVAAAVIAFLLARIGL